PRPRRRPTPQRFGAALCGPVAPVADRARADAQRRGDVLLLPALLLQLPGAQAAPLVPIPPTRRCPGLSHAASLPTDHPELHESTLRSVSMLGEAGAPRDQARVLGALAPHLPEELLPAAVDAAIAIQDE